MRSVVLNLPVGAGEPPPADDPEVRRLAAAAANMAEELEKNCDRSNKTLEQGIDNMRAIMFDELKTKFEELSDADRATRDSLDALDARYQDSVAKLEVFGTSVHDFQGKIDGWAEQHQERVNSIEAHITKTTEAVTEKAFVELSGRISAIAGGEVSAPASIVVLRASLAVAAPPGIAIHVDHRAPAIEAHAMHPVVREVTRYSLGPLAPAMCVRLCVCLCGCGITADLIGSAGRPG